MRKITRFSNPVKYAILSVEYIETMDGVDVYMPTYKLVFKNGGHKVYRFPDDTSDDPETAMDIAYMRLKDSFRIVPLVIRGGIA